jgi:hypothetical protein
MDKITNYQEILLTFLKEYVDFFEGSSSSVKPQMIIDKDRNHYQLVKIGWDEKQQQFVFGVLFHFDIINDKIWLQLNNTEFYVVDELVEMGVPKSDIVLGFQPPTISQLSTTPNLKEKVA